MGDRAQSNVERVVLLSGPIASGKTTLARLLEQRFGLRFVGTRNLLAPGVEDRRRLQAAGTLQDEVTGGSWVRDGLVRLENLYPTRVSLVVDSVRTLDQVRWVRETYGSAVEHIHLTAGLEVLASRYGYRSEGYQYYEVRDNPVEKMVGFLSSSASLIVDTTYLCPELVLLRVTDHLSLPT